jgi:hypothetical protein
MRQEALALVVALLLAGCTSWSAHGVDAVRSRKLALVVRPVRVTADIRSLRQIMTVPGSGPIPQEPARIHERLAAVGDDLTARIAQGLADSPWFRVVPDAPAPAAAAAATAVAAAEARRLGTELGAQAVLAVDVSAYGGLSRTWTAWLIGSGVVEGTVEGAVIYGATGSAGAGLLVGGEEIGQEVLTWGGGSYLFNKWFDPVILEASLFSTQDGTRLWTDTVVSTADSDQLKALPAEERAKRQVRLRLTANRAVRELLADLNGAAYRSFLERMRPRPGSRPADD